MPKRLNRTPPLPSKGRGRIARRRWPNITASARANAKRGRVNHRECLHTGRRAAAAKPRRTIQEEQDAHIAMERVLPSLRRPLLFPFLRRRARARTRRPPRRSQPQMMFFGRSLERWGGRTQESDRSTALNPGDCGGKGPLGGGTELPHLLLLLRTRKYASLFPSLPPLHLLFLSFPNLFF